MKLSTILKFRSSFLGASLLVLLVACGKDDDRAPGPSEPASPKELLSVVFKMNDNTALFEDVYATVIQNEITLPILEGTDISSLKPTILFKGASVRPATLSTIDLNHPPEFVVTGKDGLTKTYTVRINLYKGDRLVYAGSDDGYLYALSGATGMVKWKFKTGGIIQATPTLWNNTIFVGSQDGYLYALDPVTGALKWQHNTNVPVGNSSPVVANGLVYLAGFMDGFFAIDANTGQRVWSDHRAPFFLGPVAHNGNVIISTYHWGLYCFNAQTGNLVWKSPAGIGVVFSNAMLVNDKLFITGEMGLFGVDANSGEPIWGAFDQRKMGTLTSKNGIVYGGVNPIQALDPLTKTILWKFPTSNPVEMSGLPFIDDNHVYYYSDLYNVLAAFDIKAQKILWQSGGDVAGRINNSPVATTHRVYVNNRDYSVYAFNKSGHHLWRYEAGGKLLGGLLVWDSDGKIYHSTLSGNQQ